MTTLQVPSFTRLCPAIRKLTPEGLRSPDDVLVVESREQLHFSRDFAPDVGATRVESDPLDGVRAPVQLVPHLNTHDGDVVRHVKHCYTSSLLQKILWTSPAPKFL